MFVFGIVLSLPGTVLGLPEAAAQLDLAFADRGLFISALFVGLLAGSLASGPIVDRMGQRAVLAASAAAVAGCLPLFAAASGFALAVAALAALGLACAGMNTAANALSSELFPSERGRRMNGLALMVGLGGLALPAAIALAAGALSWRAIVVSGGIAAGAAAIVGAVVAAPPAVAVQTGWAAFSGVLRQPGFAWSGLMVLLGAATEASVAGWTSTYLGARGFTPAAATWALSSHWLGLVIGRIALSRQVDRGKATAVTAAALCGSAAIAGFALAGDRRVLAAAPFVIGLAIAVVVPTSLALAGERYRVNAGTLFGILLTLAQAGAMIVPSIVGIVAEEAGLRAGMLVIALNGIVIAAATRRVHAARRGTT